MSARTTRNRRRNVGYRRGKYWDGFVACTCGAEAGKPCLDKRFKYDDAFGGPPAAYSAHRDRKRVK